MQITCPNCNKSLRVADSAAGKKVKCPACATAFTAVDQVEELVQEAPPPPRPKAPARPKVDQVEEIEEERPRPPRRRDDEDDDDDRPRRSRSRDDDDEDDDRPRRGRRPYEDDNGVRKRRKSSAGSVTSVGVITIILGSLTLLCGVCSTVVFLAGVGPQGFRGQLPAAVAGIATVISIVILILGGIYLVGGIGLLQRRNWGRIMTLVMAGFSALLGVFCIISAIGNMMTPVPMEAKIAPILVAFLAMFIYFTHCIMSFVVLLSGQNAREFD